MSKMVVALSGDVKTLLGPILCPERDARTSLREHRETYVRTYEIAFAHICGRMHASISVRHDRDFNKWKE